MKASLRCLLVVVLVGDFDLDEDAFEELRRLGYSAVPDNHPTSLRRRRRDGPGDDLASESAHIFYETAPFWGPGAVCWTVLLASRRLRTRSARPLGLRLRGSRRSIRCHTGSKRVKRPRACPTTCRSVQAYRPPAPACP